MKKKPKESQENGTEVSEKAESIGQPGDTAFDLPSGLRRTLSTELVTKQAELRTVMEVNGLIESR
ncbi:MAG: hypothetical protein JRF37_09965, partial [Deltaproteobacteria bacterium]|nr:hypothetical protein [Deltaproteobacteria bacterium]